MNPPHHTTPHPAGCLYFYSLMQAAAKQAVLSNSNVPESLQYDALAADAQMALHTARCMLLPLPLS